MLLPLYDSLASYLEKRRCFTLDDYAAERETVREIIAAVRQRGDAAVKEYTALYDGAALNDLRVSEAELKTAEKTVEPSLLEALREAKENIENFHRRQLRSSWWESGPGCLVGQPVSYTHLVMLIQKACRQQSQGETCLLYTS